MKTEGYLSFSLAGAEGIEPSARGFGVAVEVRTLYKTSLVSQALTNLEQFVLSISDAFLMLSPSGAMHPSHRTMGIILYAVAFVNPLFLFFEHLFEYLYSLRLEDTSRWSVVTTRRQNDSNMEGSYFLLIVRIAHWDGTRDESLVA